MSQPLSASQSWEIAGAWLAAAPVRIPHISETTGTILVRLITESGISGNLLPDAELAAIPIENGLTVVTLDTDFARFPVQTLNPTIEIYA